MNTGEKQRAHELFRKRTKVSMRHILTLSYNKNNAWDGEKTIYQARRWHREHYMKNDARRLSITYSGFK